MSSSDIESLFRFDSIRLFKLLEIFYYSIISFSICLLFGNYLENDKLMPYIFKSYDYDKVSISKIFVDICKDIFSLIIVSYYTKKLLKVIPFIFASLNKNYIPSKKGEINLGITLGMGLVFYTSLHTLSDKIKNLNKRIQMLMSKLLVKNDEKKENIM